MAATMQSEFDNFFALEEAPEIDSFEYELLAGFGIMDSHQYREKYKNLTKKEGFGIREHMWLFILVNQVKSLDRLKDTRGMKKAEFMAKYGKEAWYQKVMNFLSKQCVMYVSETKPGKMNEDKFPIVNINTCWPTMAFAAFCYRLHGEKTVNMMSDEEIQDAYLAPKNTWTVQMKNLESLQQLTKVSNELFWTKTVTKSNNPVSGAYEGRVGASEGTFNPAYYKTQSEDEYLFCSIVSGKLKTINGMKSMSEVIDIIRKFA